MKSLARSIVALIFVFSLVLAFALPATIAVAQTTEPPSTGGSLFPLTWSTLWPLVQSSGPVIMVITLLVLVLVFLADMTDLLKSGWMKRVAVIILATLFSNVQSGQVDAALVGAISAVAASILKVLLDLLFGLAVAKTQARAAAGPKKA